MWRAANILRRLARAPALRVARASTATAAVRVVRRAAVAGGAAVAGTVAAVAEAKADANPKPKAKGKATPKTKATGEAEKVDAPAPKPAAGAPAATNSDPVDPEDPTYALRLRVMAKLGNSCACHATDLRGPCAVDMFRCVGCMDAAMRLCTADDMRELKAVHTRMRAAAAAAADDATEGAVIAAAGLSAKERQLLAGPNCMDLTEFAIVRTCLDACSRADECRAAHPKRYPDDPNATAGDDADADAADAPRAIGAAEAAKVTAK